MKNIKQVFLLLFFFIVSFSITTKGNDLKPLPVITKGINIGFPIISDTSIIVEIPNHIKNEKQKSLVGTSGFLFPEVDLLLEKKEHHIEEIQNDDLMQDIFLEIGTGIIVRK